MKLLLAVAAGHPVVQNTGAQVSQCHRVPALGAIASLRDQLARTSETARILLMSDSAKNDLIRQYLYDDVVPPQR